ncbi:hypothetical protein MRB53_038687 [Persea americana]|nr:hypothetical protein MRB53_038687 [Persea americana]
MPSRTDRIPPRSSHAATSAIMQDTAGQSQYSWVRWSWRAAASRRVATCSTLGEADDISSVEHDNLVPDPFQHVPRPRHVDAEVVLRRGRKVLMSSVGGLFEF